MSQYSLAIRFKPEALRSLAFGSVGAGYTALGTPMDNPVISFCIDNDTDANIIVSFDGSTDHMFIAANGYKLYDVQANHGKGLAMALAQETQVYVKRESSAPTSGNVYLTIFYASNS